MSRSAAPTDLDIAQAAKLLPIWEIAEKMGLGRSDIELYGDHMAKVRLEAVEALADRPNARYVLVTAITPTPLGEGKSTTTVGLGQGMHHIGKSATVAIRQPSQGPTFGIKGGAAGGGYSQVVPMEQFNLHMTGDMHAVTAANNLLAAMIDAHIYQGNALEIDPYSIMWRRVLDVNDRGLRNIVSGLGPKSDGPQRQTGFDITAASEVMAILALTTGLEDMRERFGRVTVGRDRKRQPVTAEQLQAAGSMTVLMKEAIKPNIFQTLENTPALVHAGPFANIAHGNSSVLADLIGIKTSDYLITEAGFGADIGAEKFFNIKCRYSGLRPDAAVLVATVRALKSHTGRYRVVPGRPLPDDMLMENPEDVEEGAANLRRQIQNVRAHGVSPVVCVNCFASDFQSEIDVIGRVAEEAGARWAVSTHWADGGSGAKELARTVVEAAEEPSEFRFLYELDQPLKAKIEKIAKTVYGADGIEYTAMANRQIRQYEQSGYGSLPICMAKTHLSLSHDPKLKGAPSGFTVPVREVRASVGAGFVYPLLGEMRTMPGLGSAPAAQKVDVDLATGQVIGLF
ncbi:MAG: formate--tetrahydrofolate ligase [Caldilineaceae bacterium SB0670_bin_27]|uniref:Formate--tetrahydrofolate ligase n=1 Tax=Caldilineaceae bacterium SB0664_bin_27 TaxID=2605260 RepID=A0A6B0YTT4_9CHLR|nr:formate--tetrahydrofolate ligase [Caldilineaceae bacterium SB0664_bin_27]MYJ77200.1 formate--tetrahydrofolate ligase [Caldilineaceae bacterium SB0670_bin_27]